MTRLLLLASTATLAILSTTAHAQTAPPSEAQNPGPAASDGVPGEILVTAQRRSERLQDVPVAVSALPAQALQDRGIEDLVDIMGSVPNLHASNNIGQGSATTVFIRGVGETESIISIDTPSGFYLDDVYIARQGVNNMGLFDVDRIEVLRGPQGTLYGRNTSAGALKVVTKRPQFDAVGAALEGSYGRFDAYNLKASLNLPVSDKVAVRANGIVSGGNDYVYNRVSGKDVNGTKTKGGRLAVRLAPTDDLEINIAGDYVRSNQDGTYAVDVAGVLRPTSGSIYRATSGENTSNIASAGGLNGTIEWKLGGATIKSITAWRQTKQRYNLDLTDQPVPVYTLYTQNNSKQFSQELQAAGSAFTDKLNYVAGLYYFHEDSKAFIGDLIFQSTFLNKNIGVDVKSYAAYAQVNYDFTDALSLILGGRYTVDKKSITFVQRLGTGANRGFQPTGVVLFNTANLDGRVIAARPGKPVSTDLTFKKFTPKIGLQFKPDRDLLLYATYTQGFKSGGWSARVTSPDEFFDFAPETINSYELGAKSTILGGAATLNLTGFYYDYKNLFTSGTTSTGSFGIATGDAEIYGLELETNWKVAPGVLVFANGAYEHAKRKSVSITTLALGKELQRTPKWSGTIGTNIKQPLGERLNVLANAQYSYTGKHYINPQNTPAARVSPVNLVDASVGVGSQDDRYQLTVGCRNCFGEKYITQILDFGAVPGFNFTSVYAGPRSSWLITARVQY